MVRKQEDEEFFEAYLINYLFLKKKLGESRSSTSFTCMQWITYTVVKVSVDLMEKLSHFLLAEG